MSSSDFFVLLFSNLDNFLIALFLTSFVYIVLIKIFTEGVLDPLFMVFIYSAFCFFTVLILFFNDAIQGRYLFSYLSTQFSLYLGMAFFGSKIGFIQKRRNTETNRSVIDLNAKLIFYFFTMLFVTSQLYIFFTQGFPIFMPSRLDYLSSTAGLIKVFSRIKDLIFIPYLICLFYMLSYGSKYLNRLSIVLILFTVFSVVMNGGKSSLILIASVFFIYSLYITKNNDFKSVFFIKRNVKKILLISIFAALFISFLTISEVNPFILIYYRLFSSGDVYFMSYPNGIIESLKNNNEWYINLFSSPLSIFGLLDAGFKTENIGFTLKNITEGVQSNTGPNSRFNIVAYLYLSPLSSMLFSFLIGLFISAARVLFYKKIKFSLNSLIVYASLVFSACRFETDYFNAQSNLINNFFVFFILVAIWSFCNIVKKGSNVEK